jgi:hypothetical protein
MAFPQLNGTNIKTLLRALTILYDLAIIDGADNSVRENLFFDLSEETSTLYFKDSLQTFKFDLGLFTVEPIYFSTNLLIMHEIIDACKDANIIDIQLEESASKDSRILSFIMPRAKYQLQISIIDLELKPKELRVANLEHEYVGVVNNELKAVMLTPSINSNRELSIYQLNISQANLSFIMIDLFYIFYIQEPISLLSAKAAMQVTMSLINSQKIQKLIKYFHDGALCNLFLTSNRVLIIAIECLYYTISLPAPKSIDYLTLFTTVNESSGVRLKSVDFSQAIKSLGTFAKGERRTAKISFDGHYTHFSTESFQGGKSIYSIASDESWDLSAEILIDKKALMALAGAITKSHEWVSLIYIPGRQALMLKAENPSNLIQKKLSIISVSRI